MVVVEGETCCHPPRRSSVLGKQTHRRSPVDLSGRCIFLKDFNIKSNMAERKISMNFSNENLEAFQQ